MNTTRQLKKRLMNKTRQRKTKFDEQNQTNQKQCVMINTIQLKIKVDEQNRSAKKKGLMTKTRQNKQWDEQYQTTKK